MKPRGKKRPRAWHHGRAQGRINDRVMRTLVEPAFARSEADRAETEAHCSTFRRETDDWRDVLAQLDRVAPFVPAPLA